MRVRMRILASFLASIFMLSSFSGNVSATSQNNNLYDLPTKLTTKEITSSNNLDFPVEIIQKKGPDSEKFVILFLGDGFTVDEQDKFIEDVKMSVNAMLKVDPFKDYADEFNIYALRVTSDKSGIGRAISDTYFETHVCPQSIPQFYSQTGLDRMSELIKQFESNYLDEGGKVSHSDLTLNISYAQSRTFVINSIPLSAHGYEDPDKMIKEIREKEFKGYAAFNRSDKDSYSDLATRINNIIKNKRELYISDPRATVTDYRLYTYKEKDSEYDAVSGYYKQEYKKEIDNNNITEIEGKKVEYRIVVKNFTEQTKNLTLNMYLIPSNGEKKLLKSKDFNVLGSEIKALAVESETLTGLKEGDRISGELIDTATSKVIMNGVTSSDDKIIKDPTETVVNQDTTVTLQTYGVTSSDDKIVTGPTETVVNQDTTVTLQTYGVTSSDDKIIKDPTETVVNQNETTTPAPIVPVTTTTVTPTPVVPVATTTVTPTPVVPVATTTVTPTPVVPVTPDDNVKQEDDIPVIDKEIQKDEEDKTSKVFSFTDVDAVEGNWKYDSVKYVYENNIMSGSSDTNQFEPDSSLTRSMFATVLYRMAGNPTIAYTDTFSDVATGKWYSEAILWANQEGIVSGLADGQYGIDINITREQIAKMLYEYAKRSGYDVSGEATLDDFTDKNSVSGWATDYMKWASSAGMISGKPNGDGSYRLDPKGEATRAECAAMLKRFIKKYQEVQ